MIGDALRMIGDDLPLVPLYRRTLTWAMAKIDAVQWPNDVDRAALGPTSR